MNREHTLKQNGTELRCENSLLPHAWDKSAPIFVELVVLLESSNADFSVRFTRQLSSLFSAVFLSDLFSFLVFVVLCSHVLAGNEIRTVYRITSGIRWLNFTQGWTVS